jgi:hypothetical protein
VHEYPAHAIRTVCLDRPPALLVGCLDDGGAELFDCAELRLRGRVHDHYRAGGSGESGGESDALRRVAGAHGPDALRQLRGIQMMDGILRAPNLEGSDRLQRFEFQKDLGSGLRAPWKFEPYQRRANRHLVHGVGRFANGVEGDASGRRRGYVSQHRAQSYSGCSMRVN